MDSDRLADAFGLLDDETRVSIVRELALAMRDRPFDRAASFSDLREAVGVRDSGGFNYHLDRLRGTFVESTEEGYVLTGAGIRVAGAIVGGYYSDDVSHSHTLGLDCPVCGDAIDLQLASGVVSFGCEDHGFTQFGSAGLFDHQSPRETARIVGYATVGDVRLAANGACPLCHSPMQWFVTADPAYTDEPRLNAVCEACGLPLSNSASVFPMVDPALRPVVRDCGLAPDDDPALSLVALYDAQPASATPASDEGQIAFERSLPDGTLVGRVETDGRTVDTVAQLGD